MDSAPYPPRDHASGTGDAQQKQQALAATQALGGGIDDDPDEFPALLAEARQRRSGLDVQPLPGVERSASFTASTTIPTAIVTHTDQTVRSVFVDGTATPLTTCQYSVRTSKGRTTINGVNPGVLFYWAKFTSTGTGSQTLVSETSTAASAYLLQYVSSGSNIYRAGQTTVAKGYRMSWNAATGTLSVSGLAAGDYWIGIKFSASALSGLIAPSPSSATYGFTAGTDASTARSLTLSKKV